MNYRFRAHLYDCKVGIGIRYRWWAKEEHSPFWARLHFDDPHVQARVHEALDWHHPTLNGGDAGPQDVLVPLTVKRQANRRIVVRHILDQLNTIADCLQLVLKQDG